MRKKYHKTLKKVEKSSSETAHDVRRRRSQMRGGKRETSLLARYAKMMSLPKAPASTEPHDDEDDDDHETTASEIEAIIERQEKEAEEEKALDAELRARENKLRALEGGNSPLPSPLHENGCWMQSGDGMILLRTSCDIYHTPISLTYRQSSSTTSQPHHISHNCSAAFTTLHHIHSFTATKHRKGESPYS
ncbi:MAG: hypothetical protein Q9187_007695 [Circinaria calcarea]